jgi:hypothetical protein
MQAVNIAFSAAGGQLDSDRVLLVVNAAGAPAGPAYALEAIAAVDGPVTPRLEGDLGLLAAAAANDVEHLPLHARPARKTTAPSTAAGALAIAAVATLRAAGTAALGIAETARGVELLVVRAERELLSAVSTH